MAAKDVKFGAKARESMIRGVDILADAVNHAFTRGSAELNVFGSHYVTSICCVGT